MITNKMFVGTEAEGPLRGYRTLFVPVGCDLADVRWKARSNGCMQIYFGAGESRPILKHFDLCVNLLKVIDVQDPLMTLCIETASKSLFGRLWDYIVYTHHLLVYAILGCHLKMFME